MPRCLCIIRVQDRSLEVSEKRCRLQASVSSTIGLFENIFKAFPFLSTNYRFELNINGKFVPSTAEIEWSSIHRRCIMVHATQNDVGESGEMLALPWREFGLDPENRHIRVGNQSLKICSVSNSELGTGLVLWDGAVVLAKYLEFSNAHIVSGESKVIELGCGTGLVGLTAAVLGAKEVYLTDLPYALENIMVNIEENKNCFESISTVAAQPLDWNNHQNFSEKNFDIILAADVIWTNNLISPFVATLERLMRIEKLNTTKQNDVVALLSYQERSRETTRILLSELNRIFEVTAISENEYHPMFKSDKIKIFSMSNKRERS